VKSVINDFSAVMEQRERVTFLGGVDVGTDIGVTDLCKHYNAVVFATGSQVRHGMSGCLLDVCRGSS